MGADAPEDAPEDALVDGAEFPDPQAARDSAIVQASARDKAFLMFILFLLFNF
jgi:hypothetical protein